MSPRRILLLQGPPGPFWSELGAGLRAAGHTVRHTGFSLADALLWRGPGARLYRGRLADWPGRLAADIARHGITDILYYADRLPYHRAAIEVAREAGIRAWAVENGYLRPDWITLEPEAMGAFSRLTRDPAEIRRQSAGLPMPDFAPQHRHGFGQEARAEVAYHLAMALGRPLFPRYVSDKHYPPALDYASWLLRWTLGRGAARAAHRAEADCRPGAAPFVLLALQLQSDYQIRASSPYGCLSEMLEEVTASFAAHAPAKLRLLVKLHPMDNGWEAWPRRVRRIAEAHGVAARVTAIDGGDLGRFLAHAAGLVTVNSTTGLAALRLGCPVVALGDAVYDIPGLTHQRGLGRFWTRPDPIDRELLDRYLALLAARVQVRGSFYAPAGRAEAIAEIARRLAGAVAYWRLDRPLWALGGRGGGPVAAPAADPTLARAVS